ncbi:hypothetical protein PMZ80_005486 [Knufia obscura]|uniref:WW domain-containing protein n=1 Tax=Knufia obscura TaxID=1635080 RepID=A0ABR0RMR1_9EURO|nr:hypothetical protein PMZ80_005486 [Knufia obscura]
MAEKQPVQEKISERDRDTSLNEQNEELDISDTRHPEHSYMSWTACYEDDCYVYKSDKDGSGWYPKKPRKVKKPVR